MFTASRASDTPPRAPSRSRRNRWDLAATVLLMVIGMQVGFALAIVFFFVATWGSYGAGMTGDQSWIGMILVLGVAILGCLSGMFWSVVRLVRRRTAFWIMLVPVVAGLSVLVAFGLATGDVSNVLAWLFPWWFLGGS